MFTRPGIQSRSPWDDQNIATAGPTLYRYRSAAASEATQRYAELAKKAGLSLTELSLRPPGRWLPSGEQPHSNWKWP